MHLFLNNIAHLARLELWVLVASSQQILTLVGHMTKHNLYRFVILDPIERTFSNVFYVTGCYRLNTIYMTFYPKIKPPNTETKGSHFYSIVYPHF